MWGTPVPFSHGPLLRGCQRSGGVRLQLLAGEMTSAQDESQDKSEGKHQDSGIYRELSM